MQQNVQNDKQQKEDTDFNTSLQDSSFIYEELNYGDLEQSLDAPAFEFSSPISSISSNCSSPDRTVQQQNYETFGNEIDMNDSDEFVSLEELRSQISPLSDDELCITNSATLVRKSMLETIYEDVYLETPPGTPSAGTSSATPSEKNKKRKRRLVRTDLSKCDEFKENVQMNS